MDIQEQIQFVQMELTRLSYYHSISDDIGRLIGLVQENQEFFNNPPAGESCVKIAVDKLKQLVEDDKKVAR